MNGCKFTGLLNIGGQNDIELYLISFAVSAFNNKIPGQTNVNKSKIERSHKSTKVKLSVV